MDQRQSRAMFVWMLSVVAAAALLGGCAPTNFAGGQVYSGTAAANPDFTYKVTLKGDFIADDAYVVTGPPNDTVYMLNVKPVGGDLVFTANMAAGTHTFVVWNATIGISAGEVNVVLP